MALSYRKLWKLLIDKNISKAELRKLTGIAPNTMTKLSRNDEVTLGILIKICEVLNVDIGDVVEYISDSTEAQQ